MTRCQTDILMYHSISHSAGSTSISPEVFAAQMAAISVASVPVIDMDEVSARHGAGSDAPYAIAITFDDGFVDFRESAWPILRSHGFKSTVYLPAGLVGGHEKWHGCNVPPRRIMDWATIGQLAAKCVVFGSHANIHADLTTLNNLPLEEELVKSKNIIEARLNRPVRHFAPPYGCTNAAIRHRIAQLYTTSVGTRLATANARSDAHNLPRIEMHYFSDCACWKNHLEGRGSAYLARRRLFRAIGRIVRHGK